MRRGVVPELESAWLFKIAHNVCLSRHRSAWRRGRIESPADFASVEELAPAPSRRADELIGLQDVLEQMPESQRRAILLREWQGLSYREIAAELELSQTAVETLIFRARRSLAAGLQEPPPARRRRVLRAADLGNLAAAAKSLLLGGGVAAKLAVTAALVGGAAVVAAAPQHRGHSTPVQAHAPAAKPAAAAPVVHPVRVAGAARSATPPTSKAPAAHARNAARRTARTVPASPARHAEHAYGRVGKQALPRASAHGSVSVQRTAKTAKPAHASPAVRAHGAPVAATTHARTPPAKHVPAAKHAKKAPPVRKAGQHGKP